MDHPVERTGAMAAFTEADRRKILESLTADELETFKEAFTVFDRNQDGSINTKVSATTFIMAFANMAFSKGLFRGPFRGPFLQQIKSCLSTLNLRGQLTRFMAANREA